MIGILYEHPEWFRPLFGELDRRGLRYERIPAHELTYDPSATSSPYSLVVNRMSPSSYLRGHGHAIFSAMQYLAHLEAIGVPTLNGARAYEMELSKARQLTLLARLGLPHPRSRVVNHPSQVAAAAAELEFPVIVKPNIGGSGALMQAFDSSELLAAADLTGVFGVDQTAIVQEYHPAGGSIVRVECLADRLLYAIRIPSVGFNLCPADVCALPGQAIVIEATTAPDWVVDGVLRVFREAGIEVGGVEYLQSDRDGQLYLYDVNSLSNFVANAPTVVGFDPFVNLVDYIEKRAAVYA